MSAPTSLELTAGRELDALIAERVMGRHVSHPPHSSPGYLIEWQEDPYAESDSGSSARELPHYSTEIIAAWEVMKKINARGEWVTVGLNIKHLAQCFIATSGERENVEAEAETAPLAICLAALKAVAA